MGTTGRWGTDLIFYVSSERQLPLKEFKREVKARWATHNINLQRPIAEFKGIEQGSISISCEFSAHRGYNARHFLEYLEDACKSGEANPIYIGGKRVGDGPYYIERISETWDEIWNNGELVSAKADIDFKEYR